jgi:transposase
MSPDNVAYIAIELSVTSWVVAARLPGAEKPRLHRIEGGDTAALLGLIAELRSRASAKGGRLAKVVCSFEAGRDGFQSASWKPSAQRRWKRRLTTR